jgi:hypothetical protein
MLGLPREAASRIADVGGKCTADASVIALLPNAVVPRQYLNGFSLREQFGARLCSRLCDSAFRDGSANSICVGIHCRVRLRVFPLGVVHTLGQLRRTVLGD